MRTLKEQLSVRNRGRHRVRPSAARGRMDGGSGRPNSVIASTRRSGSVTILRSRWTGAEGPVDSIASNMGHLLGTGILGSVEEAAVARHLADPALASGWGLRTLSSASPEFNPLGYHTGSVWTHDAAIAAWGLLHSGRPGQAVELLRDLVDAVPHFGYRMPELYGGEQRVFALAPLPHPAACRPQAWSAAAVIVFVTVLTGLEPDVPAGRLKLRGPQLAPFGPMEVRGITVGTIDVTLRIDADGRVHTLAAGVDC